MTCIIQVSVNQSAVLLIGGYIIDTIAQIVYVGLLGIEKKISDTKNQNFLKSKILQVLYRTY